jgi:hypothetical protein
MSTLLQDIHSAIRRSVPLVSIATPDPWQTIHDLCAGTAGELPKLEWDIVRGFTGRNKPGLEAVEVLTEENDERGKGDPLEALKAALELPERSLLFIHLADRWLAEPVLLQAVWNLRNPFKNNNRMLVLLSKAGKMPIELSDDVMGFDEPLPDSQQLEAIVLSQYKAAELEAPDGGNEKAIEALRGLSAFSAEQITAMSLRRKGIDVDALWERKRQQVEQTPGLKIFRGGDRFDGIGGCDVVKGFLQRVLAGQGRPNAIVFIDEIEKAMAGAKGDMSGVGQDQLGSLLTYMQDHSAAGGIFLGPPGAAKTAVAKAAGNEAGIPTIQLDLGAMKGSLVGQSEQQLRAALKVITAVSNSKALFIATCNSIAELPPELRRRFTLGTFFFDLPDSKERLAIWEIWTARYFNDQIGIRTRTLKSLGALPPDDGWTGAEIRQCCDIAWRLGCSFAEAAAFVVPVSKSAAEAIGKLRQQAHGKFLSASHPGLFNKDSGVSAKEPAKNGRKIQIDD